MRPTPTTPPQPLRWLGWPLTALLLGACTSTQPVADDHLAADELKIESIRERHEFAAGIEKLVVINEYGEINVRSMKSMAVGVQASAQIYGAEPSGAADAQESLQAGELRPWSSPQTACDGLRANLGELNFRVLQQHRAQVLTVSDAEAAEAMRLVWERMKIVIELSCATAVAVLLKYPQTFAGQRVGVIFSGGNVDLSRLPWQAA